jgi:hypothetical protein
MEMAGFAAVNGIGAFPVEVEVNSGWGDTVIAIVGYFTPKTFFDWPVSDCAMQN